jgi:four helix bundle protein
MPVADGRPSSFGEMTGDFRNLKVWIKAHALALHCDRVAPSIRATRHTSLKSQLVRAAMSIPANIAEGRRQESEKNFARFLRYSVNSAYELEYHLVVGKDMMAIEEDEANSMLAECVEVRKMLHGLLKTLSKGSSTKPKRSNSP